MMRRALLATLAVAACAAPGGTPPTDISGQWIVEEAWPAGFLSATANGLRFSQDADGFVTASALRCSDQACAEVGGAGLSGFVAGARLRAGGLLVFDIVQAVGGEAMVLADADGRAALLLRRDGTGGRGLEALRGRLPTPETES